MPVVSIAGIQYLSSRRTLCGGVRLWDNPRRDNVTSGKNITAATDNSTGIDQWATGETTTCC